MFDINKVFYSLLISQWFFFLVFVVFIELVIYLCKNIMKRYGFFDSGYYSYFRYIYWVSLFLQLDDDDVD